MKLNDNGEGPALLRGARDAEQFSRFFKKAKKRGVSKHEAGQIAVLKLRSWQDEQAKDQAGKDGDSVA